MTVEQIKEQFDSMTSAERADLALYLIRSLDGEDNADEQEVEQAWIEEVDRRVEEIKSGKAVGIPAEAFFASLREKLK